MAKTEKLADRVKKLREERGWSQTDLAKKAGLSAAFLSRLMTGERDMTFEYVEVIARALGQSPGELVAGTEHEKIASKWVTYEKFDEAERGRLLALQERDLLRRENEILSKRITELAAAEQAAKEVPVLRHTLDQAHAAYAKAIGERDTMIAHYQALQAECEQCKQERLVLHRAFEDARRQVAALQVEAARVKTGAGIVTGLGILTAMLIAGTGDSTTPRRR